MSYKINYKKYYETVIPSIKWKTDGWGSGLCPLHNDTNPSFSANANTGGYICHAGCGQGNFTDFFKLINPQVEGKEDINLYLKENGFLTNNGSNGKNGSNGSKGKSKFLTLEQIEPHHQRLLNNKEKLNTFIQKYGLNLETIKKYKLGLNNNYYTIPISMGKRTFNLKHHHGYQTAGSKATLYPVSVLATNLKNVIVTEGEFKALLLLQLGFDAVSITGGANTFTPSMAQMLNVSDNITLAYDADEAGLAGQQKAFKVLKKLYKSKSVKTIRWSSMMNNSKCKDVTDFFLKLGKSAEDFQQLIDESLELNDLVSIVKQFGYFDDGNFKAPLLAEELCSEFHFLYANERLYVYQDGLFSDKGIDFVKKECQKRLEIESKTSRINEVLNYIFIKTLIDADRLNKEDHLLNLENGMYNVETKELLPYSPKYMSTVRIPVKYNPDAECPAIDHFFKSTLNSDCIELVEEMLGYCLVTNTDHPKAFICIGSGKNGKSTFLDLLETFVGPSNVSKIPIQELDAHKFKRAELEGKLVNMFADLSSKALEFTAYFKSLVAGDSVDAERKGQQVFYFRSHATHVYSANEMPKVFDKSDGFDRRIAIIPFEQRFDGKKQIIGFIEYLTSEKELSGLFNRAMTGFKRLTDNKDYSEKDSVKKAKEQYNIENDSVMEFINAKCTVNPEHRILRIEFYEAYCDWCEKEKIKPQSRNKAYKIVRQSRDFKEVKSMSERFFAGIVIAH